MKYFMTIFLFLFFSNAFADASVFGLEINKATIDDVISQYGKKRIVNGKNGDKYIVLDTARIQFKNLEKVTAVFDKRGVLVLVYVDVRATFGAYADLKKILDKKYKIIATVEGIGKKTVYTNYKEGRTIVSLVHNQQTFEPVHLQYVDMDYFKTSSLNESKPPKKSMKSQL